MRLHWKLMVMYGGVIILAIAVVHICLDRSLRQFHLEKLTETLVHQTQLVGDVLGGALAEGASLEALNALAIQLSRRLDARLTLIEGGGRVLADSDVRGSDIPGMENHAGRPEVQDAWRGGTGSGVRYSTTLEQKMLYVAGVVPGVGDGRTVVRLAVPLRDVGQIQERVSRAVWMASALGIALALALAYGGARFVSRPIVQMTRAAREVGSGRFPEPVEVPEASALELRNLGHALNDMQHEVRVRMDQVLQEKSRLEAVLASITEGILVTGYDGRVLMVNRVLSRLFGIPRDYSGRLPVELIRLGKVQEAIDRTLQTGEETVFEMMLPGGLEQHLDVHVAPILQKGQNIGAVTVFYDITELRRLERVRKDFVANVSHELRTPLTAIKGCAATLAEGALDDRGASERFVNTILNHADRLQRLLDDLLDLSRLESGKLELALETCAVRRVVETALGQVRQSAVEKKIEVAVDVSEEIQVRCDPKLIEQALINLLDNAVKYTSDGGSVRVVARGFKGEEPGGTGPAADPGGRETRRVALEVIDTGIGIPSEALPRVFERFYRVHKGRSRAMGGTGLGLSIVRHILEAHGERAYVRSELGHGSTFGFTLPVV